MVVIDNEGKLFGKINIIDFIALILMCLIFIALLKFFNFEKTEIENNDVEIVYENIKINMKLFNQPDWFIDSIKEGNEEIFENKTRAVIKRILISPLNDSQKNADIEIDLVVENRKDIFYYLNNQEVKIGKNINIKFNRVDIYGLISNINNTNIKNI